MKLMKVEMNKKTAEEILKWNYEPPYDFYNNELSNQAVAELLNGTYYAVLTDKEELYGFFCMGESAQVPSGKRDGIYEEPYIDMGLGMNPKRIGKGDGMEFVSFVLYHIEETHQKLPIRLTVADFNKRAVYLYTKLGFELKKQFKSDSSRFITMVKKC